MTFFSVVIPLYNKEKDIKSTLQSVLRQTYTDFELIVVNDGSTDNSEAEVLSLNDEKLIYIKTENKGVSAARNMGIEKATGYYIAFLDADDYWYPNHLETLKVLADAFPQAGAIATNYEFKHPNNTVTNTYFENIDANFKGVVKDFFKSGMHFRLIWTSAVAIRKDVFEQIGVFDIDITLGAGEDNDMWIRTALSFSIAFDAKITATYHLGASNRISHAQTLKRRFAKLDKFKAEEKQNSSLRKFLDIYRAQYAMRHKLAGDRDTFNYYYSSITIKEQPLKTRLLLFLPAPVLRLLYKLKQKLKLQNIHFDIYN